MRQGTQRPLIAGLILAFAACGGSSKSPSPPSAPQTRVTLTLVAETPHVTQGDTALFALTFSANAAGDLLLFRLSVNGATPVTDSTQAPPNDSAGVYVIGLVLPAALPDGTVQLTVVLPSDGDSVSAAITVKDTVPPTMLPVVLPGTFPSSFPAFSSGPVVFLGGVTDSIQITVSDNHAMGWVGWTLGAPANLRDSVAVAGTSSVVDLPITVPANLAGTGPQLSFFARDSDGNVTAQTFGASLVANFVHHPTTSAALDTVPDDIVYDAKRNMLYMIEYAHPSIAVFSLASMSYQAPITVPGSPIDLDITPGGDSLVVTLRNSGDVVFFNLVTRNASILHLTVLDNTPGDTTSLRDFPATIRIAADQHAIIGTAFGGMVVLDLTRMSDTIVDVPNTGFIQRTDDATKVLIPFDGHFGLFIYDAATHTFTGSTAASVDIEAPLSVNTTGSLFTAALQLFNPTTYLGSLSVTGATFATPPATTITKAGTSVFSSEYAICATGSGSATLCPVGAPSFLLKSAISGTPAPPGSLAGQLVEVSDVPEFIQRLLMLPGDTTLLAIGTSHIMTIDLAHTAPAATHVVARHSRPRVTSVRQETPVQLHARFLHRKQ